MENSLRELLARAWCGEWGYEFVSVTDDPNGVWYDHRIAPGPLGMSRGFVPWEKVERDARESGFTGETDMADMTPEAREEFIAEYIRDWMAETDE